MRACAPWPSLFLLQTALLLRSTLPFLLPKPLQAYQYRLQQAQQLTQRDNTQQKVATMQRSSFSLNGSWPVGHSKHDQLTGPNRCPRLRLSFSSPDQHLPIEGSCQRNTNEALFGLGELRNPRRAAAAAAHKSHSAYWQNTFVRPRSDQLCSRSSCDFESLVSAWATLSDQLAVGACTYLVVVAGRDRACAALLYCVKISSALRRPYKCGMQVP